jgi:hypothetical protein
MKVKKLSILFLIIITITIMSSCAFFIKKPNSSSHNIEIIDDASSDSISVSVEIVVPEGSKEYIKENIDKIQDIIEKTINDPDFIRSLGDPNITTKYIERFEI